MEEKKNKPKKIDKKDTPKSNSIKIENKGSGAGGANTNIKGKSFEEKTNYQAKLLENGYKRTDFNKQQKLGYSVSKTEKTKTIIYLTQTGFKSYIDKEYKPKNTIYRNPDEAYIITSQDTDVIEIKILEKKAQNVNGSNEDKLLSLPAIKKQYEIMFGKIPDKKFNITLGLCVNNFFKDKFMSNKDKYNDLKTILNDSNIAILYGDDDDYFEKLKNWIG